MAAGPAAALLTAAALGGHIGVAGDDRDPQRLLDEVCAAIALHVGAVAAVLHLFDRTGLRAFGAHPQEARELPQLQLGFGEGPCVDAWRTGAAVDEDDMAGAGARRWPHTAPAFVALGGAATRCQPIAHGDRCVAEVTAVLPPGRTAGAEALETVRDTAALVHLYAEALLDRRDCLERAGHLERALDSRVAVEQAKGWLAAQRGATPDEVFEDLRQHARAARRPIRDVARDVVAGRIDLPIR